MGFCRNSVLRQYGLVCRTRKLKALFFMLAEKKPDDQLFDTMDATDLNKRLKELMDGLSVKVPPPKKISCFDRGAMLIKGVSK